MMDSCLVRPQLYTDICKDANNAKGRTRIDDDDNDSFLHLQHSNTPVRLVSAMNHPSQQEDSDMSNIVVVVVVVEVDDR